MRIIVNHVTRMRHPRICVAGINTETFEHVRPVTPPADLITRELLREEGGPFGPGALVDLGRVVPSPSVPEIEDHRFATANAKHIEDLEDEDYLDALEEVAHADIETAFGKDLAEIRPGKLAIPAGHGTRSLAVVRVLEAELRIKFGNLFLHVRDPDPPAELRVTDARFYEPDQRTVKRNIVEDVNRRLVRGEKTHAMLGLARAMPDDDGGDVHWLQANGLCLADRAVSDAP
jgi:hypothetical protein